MKAPELYTDGQGNIFEILGVGVSITNPQEESWISYANTKTQQEYECLAPAFFERFTRTTQDN